MACAQDVAPLELHWANNILSQDGTAVSSGVSAGIGSPPQLVSLIPSTMTNNLRVNNIATCSGDSNNTCISNVGGIFNSNLSSTYRTSTYDSWNGTHNDALVNAPFIFFNDVLHIGPGNETDGFPFIMRQTGIARSNVVPLSPNSTFLRAAVQSKLIPSNSWGLYPANITSRIASQGSLILGGYSERFIQGELHTMNTTDDCPFCVQVTDMTFQTPTGNFALLNATSNLTVGLEPFHNYLTLPPDIWNTFASVTNATLSSQNLAQYPTGFVPLGNMSVTLQNGLTTIIPHKLLFSGSPVSIDGITEDLSSDTRAGLVRRGKLAGLGELGLPYLAMTYLIRDNERQTLSISNANPTAPLQGEVTPICSINSLATSSDPSSLPKSPGLSKAAAAGIAIGCILSVALILVVGWFLFRRRRWNHKQADLFDSATYALEKDSTRILEKDSKSPATELADMSISSLSKKSNISFGSYSSSTLTANATSVPSTLPRQTGMECVELEGDLGSRSPAAQKIPRTEAEAEMEARTTKTWSWNPSELDSLTLGPRTRNGTNLQSSHHLNRNSGMDGS